MTTRDEPHAARRRGATIKADRLGRHRDSHLRRLHAALRSGLFDAPEPSLPAPSDGESEEESMTMLQLAVADDPLPEDAIYRDEGCAIAPSCLRCPLDVCVYDREDSPARRGREGRDRIIRVLLDRGWPAARVAERFGLSAAQVRRIRSGAPSAPVAERTRRTRRPRHRGLR